MIIAIVCGVVFGFISAIPVAGPISALVLNLSIGKKSTQALALALGAAIIEGLYTLLAFLGFNSIIARHPQVIFISKLVAAAILLGLGIHFFRSKKMRDGFKNQSPSTPSSSGIIKQFFTGAGVSAANPTLIVSWTTVITTLYSLRLFDFTRTNAAFFSAGVCGGIFLWFNVFVLILKKYRSRLTPKVTDRSLKGIGLLLAALAIWIAASSFIAK